MSGVMMPGRRSGTLDTVMKGLAIARDVYGIRADAARLDQMEQQAQAEQQQQAETRELKERMARGERTPGEIQEMKLKGLAEVPAGTAGAIEVPTTEGRSVLLGHVQKAKDPEYRTVGDTLLKIDPDGTTSPLFTAIKPPAPKDVKTRAVTFTDPKTGEEVTQIVEDKPGLEVRGGQKPKPVTPDQSKAALFAKRMEQAEGVFTALEKDGYSRADRAQGVASLAPDVMKPEALKRQEQAEKNFLTAVLRRESGASISPSEFSTAEAQYFPRAGDPPDLLEQKRQNRQLALQGLAAEAGPDALAAIKLPAQKEVKKVESGTAYAAGAPKVGEVMDGYKFKGGDPADPKNWEPVDDTPDRPIDTGGRRR